MSTAICYVCQKPKAALSCGICSEHVCKYCAQFLDEETFSFLPEIPADLSHQVYCGPCYEAKVVGALADYNRTLQAAREIQVYEVKQGKETRLVKRLDEPLNVVNCPDRKEALLRLAFLAALGQFNALVDVRVIAEKVRFGAYQNQKWHATGVPVHLTEKHIIHDRSFWQTPN